MPREIVTLQVGQCGNQIGCKFWELALQEHAKNNGASKATYDESMSTFFRNVEKRGHERDLAVGGDLRCLRARAVLIDMEEGVVNRVMRSPLGSLFKGEAQTITAPSGAGNNWAYGHMVYGPQYEKQIMERVRRQAEACDSLQSFFVLHSLGGGTGSGLGTYIVRKLADAMPKVCRFCVSVFPSKDDDVITSPYNSMLALSKISDFADCVLPIENQALMNLSRASDISKKTSSSPRSSARMDDRCVSVAEHPRSSRKDSLRDAYEDMNRIAATLITDLTCSSRFEGRLNVDLNEITTNLVPYRGLHFVVPSMAPLHHLHAKKVSKGELRTTQSRGIGEMFDSVLRPEHQLIECEPKNDKYLACALLLRGDVQISDVQRHINKMRSQMRFIHWNNDGFKVGLCGMPPTGAPHSVLALSNNCCIRETFERLRGRFMKLYRARAHLHHYTDYMEHEDIEASLHVVRDVIARYDSLSGHREPREISRLRPLF
eukprot:g4167.t1